MKHQKAWQEECTWWR